MPNIRLTIAYDGGGFSGWQVQPGRRTVQGVIEAAIRDLTGEEVRVFSAGRTDAGVHALGQVANFRREFDSKLHLPPEKWRPALKARLPDDVVILDSAAVEDEFHATYSATRKRYRYVLRQALIDDPFLRPYAWRINTDLDVAAMRAAAQALLGTHDFRCFESDWPNKATSVRTIFDVRVERLERWPGWSRLAIGDAATGSSGVSVAVAGAGDRHVAGVRGEFIVFEIAGDGFLYNMVRAIVGTLVNVGRGRWPVDALGRIIAGHDRSLAGETAPAHGLYLVSVEYPEVSGKAHHGGPETQSDDDMATVGE